MNANENAALRPHWRDIASPAQIGMFRAVWVIGGLGIAAALVLLIGAFTANTAAGQTGQVAGLLGLIALLFGSTLVIVGLLVRFGVMKSVSRGVDQEN
ncbi:hypothetical protein [Nocardia concava]|uniref:hypothetical protein n=1 Tax=Nocardia concava TaxID=257281 RepID=UPI00031312C0|nr:hypothetical protein [Nocardia concava]